MRDYLRWPAHRAWFIDWDEKNIEVRKGMTTVYRMWPEANTVYQDVKKLAPKLEAIGFANLDFMGHLNERNVLPSLRSVIPRLLPGATLGFTFERGREHCVKPSSRLVMERGTGTKNLNDNDRRWAGVIGVLGDISKSKLRFVGGFEYQNNRSPMSLAVFRCK